MNDDLFRDAIAARAGGEDLPGVDVAQLSRHLRESREAQLDLAALEHAVAHLRSATAPATAARQERVAAALVATSRRRPGATWMAAATLVVALVAARSWLVRTPVATPLANRQPDPTRPASRDPGGMPPPGHRVDRTPLETALAELARGDRGAPLARPQDLARADDPAAEAKRLGAIAAQLAFRSRRPVLRLPDANLARATVLRAAPGGPPADTLWLHYVGRGGSLAIAQLPAAEASRRWLDTLRLPTGWRRSVVEHDGVLALVASPSCDDDALSQIAAGLESPR